MVTYRRYWIVFSLLALLMVLTGALQSWSFALSLLTVGLISAVMAAADPAGASREILKLLKQ